MCMLLANLKLNGFRHRHYRQRYAYPDYKLKKTGKLAVIPLSPSLSGEQLIIMSEPNRHEVPPDVDQSINRGRSRASLSTRAAMLTIIKCAIGAGSFSLPRAFMDGGVYISFLTTIFLGLLSAYTLLLLVDSSTISSLLLEISDKKKSRNSEAQRSLFLSFNYKPLDERTQIVEIPATEPITPRLKHCSTYPEMGAVAFPEAAFTFRGSKYNLAHFIISIGILLTSLGVCAAYVDFIAGTLPEVIRGWSRNRHLFLTSGNTPWIIMPIILGFSFLRTMKVLTYTSFFGNLLVMMGCFTVIVLGIIRYHSNVTFNHNFVEWETLPRYVGGNTFLFAIHVVILPLMQQMENQDGNKNKRDAINGSYLFITLFNGVFGAAGFFLFDNSVCTNDQATPYKGPCDNILSSISGGNILDFVKVLVSVDLLFTIPLILAASRAVIEDGILHSALIRDCRRKWLNRLERKGKLNNGHQSAECGNDSNDIHVLTTGFNHTLNTLHSQSPAKSQIEIQNENNRQIQIQYKQENLKAKSLLNDFDSDAYVGDDYLEDEKDCSSHSVPHINDSHDYGDNHDEESKMGNEMGSSIEEEFTTIEFHTDHHVNTNPIHDDSRKIEVKKCVMYDSDTLADDIKNAQELLIRNERFTLFVQYMVRSSLVITVILMAVGIPGFGDMVALVGGFVCSFTGFFLPPIIYVRLRSKLYHLHLQSDQNNHRITRLTHNVSSGKLSTMSDVSGKSTPPLTLEMGKINNCDDENYNGGSSCGSSMNNGDNNNDLTNHSINNTHGVTYVEKDPMSKTFLLLHFLIMIFGLLTMINTVIFTIVNINGRKEAEAQYAS